MKIEGSTALPLHDKCAASGPLMAQVPAPTDKEGPNSLR